MKFDTLIQWGDSTQERVQIDDDLYFILDGIKKRLVGITISGSLPDPAWEWWSQENLAITSTIMNYLHSIGIRIVQIELEPLITMSLADSVDAYRSILNLAYENKLLVMAGFIGKYEANFDSLTNPDFMLVNGATFGEYLNVASGVASEYPNVVIAKVENEIDLKLHAGDHHAITEDQAYTAVAVQNYFDFAIPIVKNNLPNVIITHNLCADFNEMAIKQVAIASVEAIGLDTYFSSAAYMATQLTNVLSALGISGGWWNIETGRQFSAGNGDNDHFDRYFINAAFEKGARIALLWLSTDINGSGYEFFDLSGNPKQGMLNIAPYLAELQKPVTTIVTAGIPWYIPVSILLGTLLWSLKKKKV